MTGTLPINTKSTTDTGIAKQNNANIVSDAQPITRRNGFGNHFHESGTHLYKAGISVVTVGGALKPLLGTQSSVISYYEVVLY